MTIRRQRILPFITGLVCLLFAQFLIAKTDAVLVPMAFASPLQELFRFDLLNLENVIVGVVFLLLSGVFLLISFAPSDSPHWDEQPTSQVARPHLRRFILHHAPIMIVAVALFALLLIRLNQIDSGVGSPLIWIVVLLLLLWVAFRYDRKAETSLSLGLNRWDGLWIGVLLVIGLLIGTYQLDRVPNSLVPDEGNFYTHAQTIAQGKEEQSFFDVGVYTYPLASNFYQGGILRIFGDSLWSWRFSSVLAGVLTLIPLYLLTRDLFDRRVAVIAGLLLVTLPYLIAFERLGYNNVQAILPVMLALYLLYVALHRESIFYFALSGVAAALGFYTYTASRIGLLIGLIFLIILIIARFLSWLRKQSTNDKRAAAQQLRRLIAGSMIFVGFALVTVAPHLVYVNFVAPDSLRFKTLESFLPNINYGLAFFSPQELFRDYPPFQVGNEIFFYRIDLYLRLFVRNIVRSLLVFHDAALADAEYLMSPLSGTVGVVFYYIGLVFALRNLRRKEFALMLLWWFASIFFLSMISTFPARYQHMIPVIPTIALFSALGLTVTINAFAQWIRQFDFSPNLSQAFQSSLGVVAGVLLAVIIAANLLTYFVEMPRKYLPNLENIMSFDALHLQQPTHMIYVHKVSNLGGWTPWMITYMPNQADFQPISVDDFAHTPSMFLSDQPYIVYFGEDTMIPVLTVMRQLFPSLEAPPVIYHDDMNRVLGMSYSFVAP